MHWRYICVKYNLFWQSIAALFLFYCLCTRSTLGSRPDRDASRVFLWTGCLGLSSSSYIDVNWGVMLIGCVFSATSHFMQGGVCGFERELLCFVLEGRCLAKRCGWPGPDTAAPEDVICARPQPEFETRLRYSRGSIWTGCFGFESSSGVSSIQKRSLGHRTICIN
jgi:hypothetical protein